MNEQGTNEGGRHRRRRRPPRNEGQQQERRAGSGRPTGQGSGRRPAPNRPRGINWKRHFIEFLVIVAGIMVSFLLNEWRQQQKDERTEQRLLISLLQDLRADSVAIANELADLDRTIEAGTALGLTDSLPEASDSLAVLLSESASYISLSPNDLTYQEFRTTGSVALVRDADLLRSIIDLYDHQWPLLAEYQSIDKWMILERYYPFLQEQILLTRPQRQDLIAVRNEVRWNNLLANSVAFKTHIRNVLQEQAGRIDALIVQVQEAIG